MYQKHTKEEWTKAYELHKDGYDSPSISRLTGLELSEIKRHIRLYRQTGCWQTERKTNVRSTPALRRTVIDAVVKKSLSYAEVIAKYSISFTSLSSWLRKYRHGGYEELLATKPRGRPPKMNKAKPKWTTGMSEIERLREENEYLKAENAYLKKLKALDQEESAEMSGIGPKSSAN
ncbi:helix-turn-helix domain-containing protein [Hallerella succinigenes]|uniref:helix-turn-helix domain-containing protein n=1 Tax=Hallerella succinigenes TaxID=1896222 RepID=UPI002A80A24D|nr:helix-turn-helix domain-containing protein [Hallerella succinigenes]MDY5028437.1 helix-turn-helix domain-containing protein [Hallerella succinigenes]